LELQHHRIFAAELPNNDINYRPNTSSNPPLLFLAPIL